MKYVKNFDDKGWALVEVLDACVCKLEDIDDKLNVLVESWSK